MAAGAKPTGTRIFTGIAVRWSRGEDASPCKTAVFLLRTAEALGQTGAASIMAGQFAPFLKGTAPHWRPGKGLHFKVDGPRYLPDPAEKQHGNIYFRVNAVVDKDERGRDLEQPYHWYVIVVGARITTVTATAETVCSLTTETYYKSLF
jgi:hypothetical protein